MATTTRDVVRIVSQPTEAAFNAIVGNNSPDKKHPLFFKGRFRLLPRSSLLHLLAAWKCVGLVVRRRCPCAALTWMGSLPVVDPPLFDFALCDTALCCLDPWRVTSRLWTWEAAGVSTESRPVAGKMCACCPIGLRNGELSLSYKPKQFDSADFGVAEALISCTAASASKSAWVCSLALWRRFRQRVPAPLVVMPLPSFAGSDLDPGTLAFPWCRFCIWLVSCRNRGCPIPSEDCCSRSSPSMPGSAKCVRRARCADQGVSSELWRASSWLLPWQRVPKDPHQSSQTAFEVT